MRMKILSFFKYIDNNQKAKELIEQVFWFFFLVSWVPIISSFSLFPSFSGIFSDELNAIRVIIPEQKFYLRPYLGAFTVFTIICTISAILIKKYKYLFAVCFVFLSCFIFLFNSKESYLGGEAVFYIIYLLLFLYSLYFFLRNGHLLSASYLIFVAIIFLDVFLIFSSEIIWELSVGHSIFGLIFNLYDISLFKALIFLMVSIFVRMGFLIYQDNHIFVRGLLKNSNDMFKNCLKTAAALWYPMCLIFAIFTVGYYLLFSMLVTPYIVNKINSATAETQNDTGDLSSYPKDLEGAINKYNISTLTQIANDSEAAIKNAATEITDVSEGSADRIYAAVATKVPPIIFKKQHCKWYQVLCHVVRGVKSMVNNIYGRVRARQLAVLHQKLTAIENDVNSTTKQKSEKMQKAVSREIGALKGMTESGIKSTFTSYNNFSLLMTIYSFIVLFKTFMVVFARVIFSPIKTTEDEDGNVIKRLGGGLIASFVDGKIGARSGKIIKHSNRMTLNNSDAKNVYVARKAVGLEGVAPQRANPIGFFAIVSRVLNGKWALNNVEGMQSEDNQPDAIVTVNQPAQIVEWKLYAGEEIVFSFRDLAGIDGDLTLKRFVSMSLTTMIFGKMIYYTATGPGSIFIKTDAEPIVSPSKGANASLSPSKLLNWDLHSKFTVNASLKIKDVFLSDYFIQKEVPKKDNSKKSPTKTGNLIWDSCVKRGNKKGAGILRFVKSFLLPI